MSMNESEILHVCESVKRGAQMLVGRNHLGMRKIKLVKGPFGLFVERYECTDEDLATIRSRIAVPNGKRTRVHPAA
jgi:hypothetical protein